MRISSTDMSSLYSFTDDSSLDPSVSNTGTKLLNQKDALLPLMMGPRIIAPKPILSCDPYLVFDIADATLIKPTADHSFEKQKKTNNKLSAPRPSLEDKLPEGSPKDERREAIKE
ncbi:hypothetical protein EDB82DRAFT_510319 [Fusarium venenatum]|uniref:uncharacterized protein n=1 Tax=Fusarium venenatum TaxID=56646 RepID=UPI001DF7E56A|nr:hypothetical protein EDB82DRAFT_510319 [Fusarium venenatum]